MNAQASALRRQMDMSLNWRDLAWPRQHWPGKLLIKGIQTSADAVTASRYGVDGVVLICIKKGEEVGAAIAGPEFPLDSLIAIAVQSMGELRRDMINDHMAKEPVVEVTKVKKAESGVVGSAEEKAGKGQRVGREHPLSVGHGDVE